MDFVRACSAALWQWRSGHARVMSCQDHESRGRLFSLPLHSPRVMSRLLFLLLMLAVAGSTKNFKNRSLSALLVSSPNQAPFHGMLPLFLQRNKSECISKKMSDWKVRDGSNRNQSMQIVWEGEDGLGNSCDGGLRSLQSREEALPMAIAARRPASTHRPRLGPSDLPARAASGPG